MGFNQLTAAKEHLMQQVLEAPQPQDEDLATITRGNDFPSVLRSFLSALPRQSPNTFQNLPPRPEVSKNHLVTTSAGPIRSSSPSPFSRPHQAEHVVDNAAVIGYSYTVLPSTVTWFFLVLLKR